MPPRPTRPPLARLMIAAAFGLASLAMAPVTAHAQNDQDPGDQYRCDTSGAHCAYYRCDPSGQSCQRTGDWGTRDYSRGVDGALPFDDRPSYDQPGGYDQRYDSRGDSGQGYDRRYDQRPGGGYDRGDDQEADQAPYQAPNLGWDANTPNDETRSGQGGYGGADQYRCTDDNQRCAYFRCDSDGDNCHRVSGWSSRADADRRPDYDGW